MEALGQLTGGVAHDFNNLLMIVSGYIPRLKEAVGSDLRASQAALAIESASRRGAALTRQLLSFSRREPLHAEVLDVSACHPRLDPGPAQHARSQGGLADQASTGPVAGEGGSPASSSWHCSTSC